MVRNKQYMYILILLMVSFLVSCGHTKKVPQSDETGEVVEEQVELIEIPSIEPTAVTVENINIGVLIRWNEIAGADGYYVYHKKEGEKYKVIAKIEGEENVEYIDTEAEAGESYFYAVRVLVGEEKSAFEAVNITTGIWETTLKVVYEQPNMKLTWNEITGSDGYYVYRKEEGGQYSVISTIKDSVTTSYIDEDVTVGKVYTYAVRSYIGKEKSTFTAVVGAAIGSPIVKANNVNDGIEVSWNEIEEAEGYYVYRKEKDGKYTVLKKIEDEKITSYTDTDFSVGTTYVYAVRSYLGQQKSSFDAVEIMADLERVSVTLNAVATGVQLEWNVVSTAEGYHIYRKEEGEGEYMLIDTVNDDVISNYLDQQVETGKTYYYRVRAYVEDKQSSYSGGTITIE